jgi:hypothetical protein
MKLLLIIIAIVLFPLQAKAGFSQDFCAGSPDPPAIGPLEKLLAWFDDRFDPFNEEPEIPSMYYGDLAANQYNTVKWMLYGGVMTGSKCTATAIGPDTLLTAAHCFVDFITEPEIYNDTSAIFIKTDQNLQSWTSYQWLIHPNHDPEISSVTDIALIYKAPGTPDFPGPYPVLYNHITDSASCTKLLAQGFGRSENTEENTFDERRNREGEFTATGWGLPPYDTKVGGSSTGDHYIGAGDSGGPLYAVMNDTTVRIVGDLSTANDIGIGAWEYVQNFATWINDNIDPPGQGSGYVPLGHDLYLNGFQIGTSPSEGIFDAENGPATDTCHLTLSTDANPIQSAGCLFQAPNGTRRSCSTTKALGDVWSCTVTWPRYSDDGYWLVQQIFAEDDQGNLAILDNAYGPLQTQGWERRILGIHTTVDEAAPVFGAPYASFPGTATPGSSFTCAVTATDSPSGIRDRGCRFRSPADVIIDCIQHNGGSCTINVPANAQIGDTWTVDYVFARDHIGNLDRLTAAELSGFGRPSSFLIVAP